MLSVKLNAFIFGFLSMGGVLLLTLINETTDWLPVLFDVLFRSCSGIRNFESAGALD